VVEVTAPAAPTSVELYEPPRSRRSFSPGDLLRLMIAVAFLVMAMFLVVVADETISGAEQDVVEGLSRLNDRLEQSIVAAAQLFATLVPLAALLVILWLRRWRLLFSLVVAAVIAAVAMIVADRALDDRITAVLSDEEAIGRAWLTDPDFPSTSYVASAAAVVTAGAPWLSRRWKRAVWAWVGLLIVLRILASRQPVLDVGTAVAIGVVAGSVVVFVFGSPNPEPGPQELLRGLRAAGLRPSAVRRAGREDRPLFVVEEPGAPPRFVKVRTPDDSDSDLLNRLYRSIRFRSSEVDRPYSTLKRRIEHEALLLRESSRAGVRSPELCAVGTTDGGSVFLAMELVEGTKLSRLEGPIGDDLLEDIWEQVACLHRARIAHAHLVLDNFIVADGAHTARLIDFDTAELAAPDRRLARDVAELLVDISLLVGEQRAVAAAVAELGAEAVAASLPLLQPLALASSVRRRLRGDTGRLARVQEEVRRQTGAGEIELDRLERIRPRTLVMIIAASLAFYSLLPQLATFDDTIETFGDAHLGWIPAVLAASALTYVFATVAFLGTVAQPVPIAASARVRVASSFTGLVGPAATGSMTLIVRFLQRAGVSTTDASAAVGLGAVTGVATHIVLMFSFFAWTGSAGVGGFSLPDVNTIMLVLAVVVAVVAVAMVLGPIRRLVVRPVLKVLRNAAGYLAEVFRSPVRVLALVGGSSLLTLAYIAALVFSVEAFGGTLTVPQIGAAYLGAAAIGNVAPTPGGLGAVEAAMVAALTGFGLDDGVAVSSVLTFRLATFWLPILPGWFVFVWMQRNDEL
jgi:undecaprenyl-diphosphatase